MTRPVAEWRWKSRCGRPVPSWDGPDDSWQDSDATLAGFLGSFTDRDVPKLRTEGRIREYRAPRGEAIVSLRSALNDPTSAKWRNLQRFAARDLAGATMQINEVDQHKRQRAAHNHTKETA